MSKKILCVVLCILMCMSLLPAGALAAEESPVEEPLIEELPAEEIPEEAPIEELLVEKASEEETPEETSIEEALEEELPEILPEEVLEESDGQELNVQLPVKYLAYKDGDYEEMSALNYILVNAEEWGKFEADSDVIMQPGCYVFSGRVETEARIVFTGNTSIILMNDCDVSIGAAIGLYSGSSLTIYAQKAENGKNPGKLYSRASYISGAGIGGNFDFFGDSKINVTCGDVYIHGGNVTAIGGPRCAGIGGGGGGGVESKNNKCGDGGKVYIYGGKVSASGGDYAAGIGGGGAYDKSGNGGNVYVYGGEVEAYAGEGAAGIGGGTKEHKNELISSRGEGGSGGYFELNGGTVTANGGYYVQWAHRGGGGAGVGGGEWGHGGTVVVNGGKLIANGYFGAGIGGGEQGDGGKVTVNGGYVEATGGSRSAGIGGGGEGDSGEGSGGNGGTFTLNGGKVKATAGYLAAGIGGGDDGAGGDVYLNGGELDVTGDPEAYAIGGGDGNTNEGDVYVKDGAYVFNCLSKLLINPDGKSRDWNDIFLKKLQIHMKVVPAGELGTDALVSVGYLVNDGAKSFTTYSQVQPVTNRIMTFGTWTTGWYVVNCDVTAEDLIAVSGDVNLILENGCTLTASKGILVPEGSSLTIYAQSADESERGSLIANGAENCAGIGGSDGVNGGTVTINGGHIVATGGMSGAGIGGGHGGNGGTVTISGGHVVANAGIGSGERATSGAGIGGGEGGNGGRVVVYGGKVIAKCEDMGGAGIGGGDMGDGGTFAIDDGYVEATGGYYAAGIGGGERGVGSTVLIKGGVVIANGGFDAAGIGGGERGAGGNVTLAGGKVTATGGAAAPGIGGGNGGSVGATIKITGSCTVKAEAGAYAARAIGNGLTSYNLGTFEVSRSITVTDNKTGDIKTSGAYETDWFEFLKGTSVDFTSKFNGKTSYYIENGTRTEQTGTIMTYDAVVWTDSWYVVSGDCTIPSVKVSGNVNIILEDGCKLTVGGIEVPAGSSLTFYGQSAEESVMGHLISTSGDFCAGIGGGKEAHGGTITVNGGYVEAHGGRLASGIGGGYMGNGGTFTINGGYVEAHGGDNAAGIGGGLTGTGGIATFAGGKVFAYGGYGSPGIGCGYNNINSGANIKITGSCTIIAEAGADAPHAIGNGNNETDRGAIEVKSGITVIDNNTGDVKTSGAYKTDWLEFLKGTSVDFSAINGKTSYYITNGTRSEDLKCTIMTGDAVVWSEPWYVVSGECTIDSVTVSGNVNLILEDGCKLTVNDGIRVEEGSSLTVYAQSTDSATMGKLYATSNTDFYAGIGSGPDKASGKITIYGGYVEARGGKQAAGIGGGYGRNGSVTIYGGKVYGYGGDAKDPKTSETPYGGGAGIGGGYNGEGTVTVYGGSVYGTGGSDGAAGIGGGKGKKGTVTVYGGTAEGHGGNAQPKNANASPTGGGAGIGGGYKGEGVVKLYGGKAYGYGGNGGGAGIGGGNSGSCNILIDNDAYASGYGGASVLAKRAFEANRAINAGAGIGSGLGSTSGTIEIKGGKVYAIGGENNLGELGKSGEGVNAKQITVNPYADYAIQVTIDNTTKKNYPTKTEIKDLSGKSRVYFIEVEKTSQMIEEEENNPTDPTNPTKPTDPDKPNTGDESLMGLWITVMLVSAMGFAVCVTKKKRVK